MVNKFDDLLSIVGTGWWNVLHYFVMGYCMGIPPGHALASAFMTPNIDHTCIPSADDDPITLHNESTTSHQVNYNRSQCSYLIGDTETGSYEEKQCTNWLYDNSTFTSTITTEFNLVCDRSYLRATYQSVLMIGVTFGSLLCGFFADKYGLKTTLIMGMIPITIVGVASSWVTNLSALLFCRFLVGFLMPFILCPTYIIVVETSAPRLRPILGICGGLPWAFGVVVCGFIGYLLRSWRWMQFTISITGIFILPILWFTDESPRWLAVKGRQKEALQILKKAAKWNGTSLPPDEEVQNILRECHDSEESSNTKIKNKGWKASVIDGIESTIILFRTPKLRKITIILYVNNLIMNLVYYGISLSGENLSSNPFVFMMLSGVVEVPAYSLPMVIVSRFGRRVPTVVSFLLSSIALLVLAAIPSRGYEWLIMTLAMLGKMTVSAGYQMIAFYSSELFPTEVRSRGMGTSFTVSQIGAIATPFITDMLGSTYPWAPSVVFGAALIMTCIITLTLPETLGTALPDTINDLENRLDRAPIRSWKGVPTSEETPPVKEKNVLT